MEARDTQLSSGFNSLQPQEAFRDCDKGPPGLLQRAAERDQGRLLQGHGLESKKLRGHVSNPHRHDGVCMQVKLLLIDTTVSLIFNC